MKNERFKGLVIGIMLILTLTLHLISPSQDAFAAQGAKPVELSFALHVPPKAAPYHSAFLPWAKEVEKATRGKIKIKFYLSQTLVKARDSYDAVKNGIADISWVSFSWTPGRFPLSGVMDLPFLSPSTFTGAYALTDLFKKYPQLRREVKDVHLLHLWVTLPYEIHTVSKPIRRMEDIRGLKLATQPGARAAVEALGGVPVTMPSPKIYQTVEKGVADGAALAWGAYKAYKLVEVTRYHANPHLGGVSYCTIMNENRWNSLPGDVQAAITEVTERMLPEILCKAVSNEAKKGIEITRKRGQEIVDFSPDELARWRATGKPAWEKWVKSMEAKGLPGAAVLEDAIRLVEKYSR
ncbi:MAG: TRAP transporter substrate-binding protein [Deltaproteobacteria bacterium]|nr:TRAP transporter substrate-binding protein [Deltaproteobacteria bacterium]